MMRLAEPNQIRAADLAAWMFRLKAPPRRTCASQFALVQAAGGSGGRKEQGRRRSIPSTALPAPDIEIGLRHPVNCTMARESSDICDPIHNQCEKVQAGFLEMR